MTRLVLAAFFLVGCEVPQPVNTEVAAPAGADEALEIAVGEWAARVPHAGRLDVGDLPEVRWFAGNCLDYPEYPDSCILGMYTWVDFAEPEIHLLVAYPKVAHETLHWALHQVGRDDPDHEAPEWDDLHEVEIEVLRAF